MASKAEKTLLDAVDSGADTGPALRPSHRVFAIDVAVVLVALWAMVVRLGA